MWVQEVKQLTHGFEVHRMQSRSGENGIVGEVNSPLENDFQEVILSTAESAEGCGY